MLVAVIGLLLTGGARSEEGSVNHIPCNAGNSSCVLEGCAKGNSSCLESCKDLRCNQTNVEVSAPCASGNSSCVPPVEATSRLLPGSDVSGNGTIDKPSTSSKFTPSPFLGVIPDHAVGQVFPENVGPRHSPFSFPTHRGTSREYALVEGEQYRPSPFQQRPASVEIQIGSGDPVVGRPDPEVRPHPPYGKPEIEIRPHSGYGKTEIEIRPNAVYGHPEIEIRPQVAYERPELESRPLGSYGKVNVDMKGSDLYGKTGLDLGQQLGFGKPDLSFRPQAVELSGGKVANNREYGKPYDPGNAIEYTGFPETRPSHPFFEAFENMKNLIKPTKGSGAYFFEDNYQDQKPVQENIGEDVQKQAFPPAGPPALPPAPIGGPPQPYHDHPPEHYRGSSKWRSLLRLLTTVLPFGLLIAALSPNVLVINPTEQPPMMKSPGGGKRSLEAPLGPCGLRKLCEALAESPADFEQFLKAAKEGSTPELQEIIRKAEEKECSTIECGQLQEFQPTQPTVR